MNERRRRILIAFIIILRKKFKFGLKNFFKYFKIQSKILEDRINKGVNKIISYWISRKIRLKIKQIIFNRKIFGNMLKDKLNSFNKLTLGFNFKRWKKLILVLIFQEKSLIINKFMKKCSNLKIIKNKTFSRHEMKKLFNDYLLVKMIKKFFKEFVKITKLEILVKILKNLSNRRTFQLTLSDSTFDSMALKREKTGLIFKRLDTKNSLLLKSKFLILVRKIINIKLNLSVNKISGFLRIRIRSIKIKKILFIRERFQNKLLTPFRKWK